MTIVIKIGGAAMEDASILVGCARAVAQFTAEGHRVVIVHGGGKRLSITLQQLGMRSEFVEGLRVTDAAARDVALMVLAGLVNKRLVAALQQVEVPAMGLCGGDGMMFRARKKTTPGRDLGFVGEISAVDLRWLEAIWKEGGVPVLASLAMSERGEYYNVNADEMASACAIACNADMLVFLTDVSGVKDASGSVIPSLSTDDIAKLISSAIISGGMLPKLRACTRALEQGVKRLRILSASQAEFLPRMHLNKKETIGTEVTCEGRSQAEATNEGVALEYSTSK